jgi:hypothetical protein
VSKICAFRYPELHHVLLLVEIEQTHRAQNDNQDGSGYDMKRPPADEYSKSETKISTISTFKFLIY